MACDRCNKNESYLKVSELLGEINTTEQARATARKNIGIDEDWLWNQIIDKLREYFDSDEFKTIIKNITNPPGDDSETEQQLGIMSDTVGFNYSASVDKDYFGGNTIFVKERANADPIEYPSVDATLEWILKKLAYKEPEIKLTSSLPSITNRTPTDITLTANVDFGSLGENEVTVTLGEDIWIKSDDKFKKDLTLTLEPQGSSAATQTYTATITYPGKDGKQTTKSSSVTIQCYPQAFVCGIDADPTTTNVQPAKEIKNKQFSISQGAPFTIWTPSRITTFIEGVTQIDISTITQVDSVTHNDVTYYGYKWYTNAITDYTIKCE